MIVSLQRVHNSALSLLTIIVKEKGVRLMYGCVLYTQNYGTYVLGIKHFGAFLFTLQYKCWYHYSYKQYATFLVISDDPFVGLMPTSIQGVIQWHAIKSFFK